MLINPLPLLAGFSGPGSRGCGDGRVLGELRWGRPAMVCCGGCSVAPGRTRRVAEGRIKAVWEYFDQGTQRAILRLHRSGNPDDLADAGGNLSAITAPALIVWGVRDPWFPARFARRIRRPPARRSRSELDDAGHWPWFDREDVIDAVDAFLGDD